MILLGWVISACISRHLRKNPLSLYMACSSEWLFKCEYKHPHIRVQTPSPPISPDSTWFSWRALWVQTPPPLTVLRIKYWHSAGTSKPRPFPHHRKGTVPTITFQTSQHISLFSQKLIASFCVQLSLSTHQSDSSWLKLMLKAANSTLTPFKFLDTYHHFRRDFWSKLVSISLFPHRCGPICLKSLYFWGCSSPWFSVLLSWEPLPESSHVLTQDHLNAFLLIFFFARAPRWAPKIFCM